MEDWYKLYTGCEKKLSSVVKERDSLNAKLERIQEKAAKWEVLRKTTKRQRDEIIELKAQIDWLETLIQESLTSPIKGDPGFNVDPSKRHICPCGCGNRIADHQREKSVFFTRACKDRVRKRIEYLRKKSRKSVIERN